VLEAVLRGRSVLLDVNLAALYEVATKVLNQAVQRNRDRFTADFMLQPTPEEAASWGGRRFATTLKPTASRWRSSHRSGTKRGRLQRVSKYIAQAIRADERTADEVLSRLRSGRITLVAPASGRQKRRWATTRPARWPALQGRLGRIRSISTGSAAGGPLPTRQRRAPRLGPVFSRLRSQIVTSKISASTQPFAAS